MPAKRFNAFFKELDEAYKSKGGEKVPLLLIGASALHLQTDTPRETQDADVLETGETSDEAVTQIKELAGRGSTLYRRHGIYIQFIKEGIPFLPQGARFHSVKELKSLQRLDVQVLDPVEIAVSKLKRFNGRDSADIQYLIQSGLVRHKDMVQCLQRVFDYFSTDARAEESFPKIIGRFHTIEQDLFDAPPTDFDLPSWI